MSFYLNTPEKVSDEIYLSENHLYQEMIIKKLKKTLSSNDDILEYLKAVYLKMSGKLIPLQTYVLPDTSPEERIIREIDHHFIEISGLSINVFLNSAITASVEEGSYISNILILMFNLATYQDPFGKNKVFDRNATKFFISELEKAFDAGHIEKYHNKIVDFDSHKIDLIPTPFYSFLNELKESESNEYIYFQEESSAYRLFEYYSHLKDLDYKDIIVSTEFINFVKESSLTNDDFSDMESIFEEFTMKVKDSEDLATELINAILTDQKYSRHLITEERIKNLSFEPDGTTIFDIFNKDYDKNDLSQHNAKEL